MPYLNAEAFVDEDAEGCAPEPEAVAEIDAGDPPAVLEGWLARSLWAMSRHCWPHTVAEARSRTTNRGSRVVEEAMVRRQRGAEGIKSALSV